MKRSPIHFLLSFMLLASLSLGCRKMEQNSSGSVEPDNTPKPGLYVLPLMQTTDIHGHVVEISESATCYRMAYVGYMVNDIRSRTGQNDKDRMLLLDGGDQYQGSSVSNLLSGWPVYVSMDQLGYDAVALGNHEFDWGLEDIVDADATLPDYDWNGKHYVNQVPVLCANLYRNGSRVPYTKDYVIVEKTAVHQAVSSTVKVKIGIVGFAINYESSIMPAQFSGKGYSIRENYEAANEIAARLESSGQCDATILLIHGAADAAAEKLGQNTVFDLVLGGHSHASLKGKTSWGLPYLQGGRYCEHAAYIPLQFTLDKKGNLSFTDVGDSKLFIVDDSRDQLERYTDPVIRAVSKEAVNRVSHVLNDVIGYIDTDASQYSIAGSGNRATPMANWMCDITRQIGEADVAFVNSGGIRTTFMLNGSSTRNITVADVYDMFPFGNEVYVYSLSYEDMLEVFRYALTSAGSSLFSRMTGMDCYYTSNYAVQKLVKDGSVIYSNGSWTGDWASRKLKLAVGSYLATSERFDDYTHMGNPLLNWNKSARLISNELVDNENAVLVLKAEAATSGGRLAIDTKPHFILAD